jgi:hypothetical protein
MGRAHCTVIAKAATLILLITFLMITGCGGAKQAQQTEASSESSVLEEYEAGFRPSDYDVDAGKVFSDLRKEKDRQSSSSESGPTVEPPVYVSGYRVQLLATTDIDEATSQKVAAEAAFPYEWFYIEYDPPTYKLRAGNFLSRSEAEAFTQILQSKGYPDAWVVPDRVQANAPPRRSRSPE